MPMSTSKIKGVSIKSIVPIVSTSAMVEITKSKIA